METYVQGITSIVHEDVCAALPVLEKAAQDNTESNLRGKRHEMRADLIIKNRTERVEQSARHRIL